MPKLPEFPCPDNCLPEYWKDCKHTLWTVHTKSELKTSYNRKFAKNTDLSTYSEEELQLYHSRAKQSAINHYNYHRVRDAVQNGDDAPVARKRQRDAVQDEPPSAKAAKSSAEVDALKHRLNESDAKLKEVTKLAAAVAAKADGMQQQLDKRAEKLREFAASNKELEEKLAAANIHIEELRKQMQPKPKLAREPMENDMVFIKPYEGTKDVLAQILQIERDGTYMVASHEHGIESMPFHIPASHVVCFARLNPVSV